MTTFVVELPQGTLLVPAELLAYESIYQLASHATKIFVEDEPEASAVVQPAADIAVAFGAQQTLVAAPEPQGSATLASLMEMD